MDTKKKSESDKHEVLTKQERDAILYDLLNEDIDSDEESNITTPIIKMKPEEKSSAQTRATPPIDLKEEIKQITKNEEDSPIDEGIDQKYLEEIMNEQDEDDRESNPQELVTTKETTITDPLEIVDRYENSTRLTEKPVTHIQYLEESIQYRPLSINRIQYQRLEKMGKSLNTTSGEKFLGRPSCLQCSSNYFFVGTSLGIIRVFDFKEQEFKSIAISEVQGYRVTAIDVSQNNLFLVAGFVNGKIMLWDLQKNLLLKMAVGIHENNILSVKFMKGSKTLVVSSDISGVLYITEFIKSMFGYSTTSTILIKNRVSFALSPLFSDILHPTQADSLNIVGVGSSNSVLVVSVDPSIKILWEFKRRASIKKGIPYIDWGLGVLPGKPEKTPLILAIFLKQRMRGFYQRFIIKSQVGLSQLFN